MGYHVKLSPSKRYRWSACPGSIREEAKYPESPSGPGAIDGTHTHTLLEECIKNNLLDPHKMEGLMLKDHEGEFIVDAARATRAKVAIDYIRQRAEELAAACGADDVRILSEQRVEPMYLLGRNDLSGTVDVQIHAGRLVELIDYKDGMNLVQAEGNLQLEQYAYGVLAAYQLPHNVAYPIDTIRMTIIQPKVAARGLNPITSHDVKVTDLLSNVGKIVAEAALTDRPDAPLVPGEAQCKYCPAKGGCSALASNVMEEIGIMFKPVAQAAPMDLAQQSADKDPATMDDQQIRQILEAAPLLRQMLDGVEKEAQRRLEAGQPIPGLKLVNGRGSRAWALPEEEMADKLVKMGIPKSSIYVTKLVSPAQAEKLVWEKRDGSKVQLSDRQLKRMEQEYIVKMAGKLTVVSESDSRPAVVLNAAPMFSAIEAPVSAESLPSWLM